MLPSLDDREFSRHREPSLGVPSEEAPVFLVLESRLRDADRAIARIPRLAGLVGPSALALVEDDRSQRVAHRDERSMVAVATFGSHGVASTRTSGWTGQGTQAHSRSTNLSASARSVFAAASFH